MQGVFARLLLLSTMLPFLALSCTTTERRLGYVETERLLSEFTMARSARDSIRSLAISLNAGVVSKQAEAAKLRQEILSGASATGPRQIESARSGLARAESELDMMMRRNSEEILRLEDENMRPVYAALNAAIRQYGEQHNYDMIWGATANGNIVHADSTLDLTDDVLRFLNDR